MKARDAFRVALVVALTVTLGVHLLMFPGIRATPTEAHRATADAARPNLRVLVRSV